MSEQSLEQRAAQEVQELSKLFKAVAAVSDVPEEHESHYSKERIEADIQSLRSVLPEAISCEAAPETVPAASPTSAPLTPEMFERKYSKQAVLGMKSESGFNEGFRSKVSEICFLFEKEQSALKLRLLDTIITMLNWYGQLTRRLCPLETQQHVEVTLKSWGLVDGKNTFVDALVRGIVEILKCKNIQPTIRDLALRAAMLTIEVFGYRSMKEESSWVVITNVCHINIHVAVAAIIRKPDTVVDIPSLVTSCRLFEYLIVVLTDEDGCSSTSPDTVTSLIKVLGSLFEDVDAYFTETDYNLNTDCCYTLLPVLELLIDELDVPRSKEIREKLIDIGVLAPS
eukprot:TRINITY_DN11483_c0_g1_i1.p1 TRINITY_DN11483_c0_g1~~TRINITY_DN11483_c0_g1_i1.p1  ORF type:complete len:341 (+),score=57.75 TRINITY_DN11483_c0_g1_i1:199-1221(+)